VPQSFAARAAQQTAPPDTVSAADSITLAERLRGDTLWVERVTDPLGAAEGAARSVWSYFADPALWIGVIGLLVHVVVILVLAALVIRFIDSAADRHARRFEALPATSPRRQRVQTIHNLLTSVARYTIWPLALILILAEIGINVGALVATAGVAGLAVGFGAQTLVRDVISGVFLLFDDTIHVGDLVRVGSDVGTVEYIGVRLIKVRKFNGEMLMVPAGELRIFGNQSIGFARVIVGVGLPYEADPRPILATMQQAADTWAATRKDVMLDERPEVQALTGFGESQIDARVIVRVVPGEQFAAERDIRMAIKEAFDAAGHEIPFPRRTLYLRREDSADTSGSPPLPDA
jgi:small conductance mechanosensitive channel